MYRLRRFVFRMLLVLCVPAVTGMTAVQSGYDFLPWREVLDAIIQVGHKASQSIAPVIEAAQRPRDGGPVAFFGNHDIFKVKGTVVRVADGDTVTVRDDSGNRYRVRLAGIDCPEKDQPWGIEAKRAVVRLVDGRNIEVRWEKKDRYGRLIGKVLAVGVDVNRRLVEEGHCWVYRRYNDDPAWLVTEQRARQGRRGLWGLPENKRMPPWEWRQRRKNHG